MLKKAQKGSIIIIFIGICLLLSGIFFSHMSDRNKGISASSGYISNGQYVAVEQGRVGANPQGERAFRTLSVLAYVTGSLFAFLGIVLFIKLKKKSSAAVVKRRGTVIDKLENRIVVIEFSDGMRRKCIPEESVFLTIGDSGIFLLKKDIIIQFEKFVSTKS